MPKPTAAANAAPMPAVQRKPHLIDLECSIADLAMAAQLVREGLVEAEAGKNGTTVIPDEVHWGLLQVVNRACNLQAEFYGLIRRGQEAANV